jgi:uncharacterized protein YjfI (DUF2170 family)
MSWTITKIHQQLQACNYYLDSKVSSKHVADTLILTFHQFGDLPVVMAVGEKQILVQAALVERDEFAQPEQIDYRLLTTHKFLPLSTIAIEQINGQDWYVMFGALSQTSPIEHIIEELAELVSNTFSVIDALEPLYKFNQAQAAD